MDLLSHHQTFFIVFKLFYGWLDVPEILNISLLLPLTSFFFSFLDYVDILLQTSLRTHSFLEMEMLGGSTCAFLISIGPPDCPSKSFKSIYTAFKGI